MPTIRWGKHRMNCRILQHEDIASLNYFIPDIDESIDCSYSDDTNDE